MQKALGLIETIGLVPAIEAADAAAKAADIILLGYENTRGGGKITVKMVGDVGAVQAAVAAGVAAASRIGKVYGHLVIPRPHDEINSLINQVDHGRAKEEPTPQPAIPTPVAETPVESWTTPETEIVPEAAPPTETEIVPEAAPTTDKHCIAITKSGERCKALARSGSKYCSFHRKLEQTAS